MLWLVTPVHGREALTRVCLEQRARMLGELGRMGVEARQLVVGDDRNLDAARELGFETLRRPNMVGLRVNDGFEWACREGGAEHVAYCGSDDWHLASYFANLPAPGSARTCAWQAFVPPTGDRLVVIRGRSPHGHAPWVISRGALAPGFRPADDRAMNGIDGSIARAVCDAAEARARLSIVGRDWNAERLARKRAFVFDHDADPLRVVDFKGGAEQITPWEAVVGLERPRLLDTPRPFETLATRYPADLCERMESFYAERRAR